MIKQIFLKGPTTASHCWLSNHKMSFYFWPWWSPSIPMVRVQIPLKPTVFTLYSAILLEITLIGEKEAGDGPFYKMSFCLTRMVKICLPAGACYATSHVRNIIYQLLVSTLLYYLCWGLCVGFIGRRVFRLTTPFCTFSLFSNNCLQKTLAGFEQESSE